MIITNAKIVLQDEIIENGCILIENEKIKGISNYRNIMPNDQEVIDANNNYVMPGFIDQHTHGGYGFDVMDATCESLDTISLNLLKEGITSFVPTTMTQSKECIIKSLKNIKDYTKTFREDRAEIIGVHLEGPFINKEYKGAQNIENIIAPNIELLQEFIKASGKLIKIVTYAPELDYDYEFVDCLKTNNIIPSAGHSSASSAIIIKAMEHGLELIAHLYNAQSRHHHRHPGVVTAGLLKDELKTEVICDLIHIDKDVIQLTYKCKGQDNLILITDSIRAKGLIDGNYELGGQNVTVIKNEARLTDGTLAGSVLKMNDTVKNAKDILNINMIELSKLSSANSAIQLGIYDKKGSISVGKDADLIIVDENINIMKVIKLGKIVDIWKYDNK